ncbi:MAG: glycosyltransferase [Pirellulaceae bacterium]|nr:glycosyltransferase [Pirellulaceae bacterium]
MATGFLLLLFALPVALSTLLVLHHWESRRLFRSRLREYAAKAASWPTPPVSLIAPVKGADPGMEGNLRALLELDYPCYEVIFVVEDASDPAVGVIAGLLRTPPPVPARMVIAGRGDLVGQKVHNLLQATARLPGKTRVLAFVDADARPAAGWLRILVNRLRTGGVGASTGYRWMVPERRTLPNLMVYSINSCVATLLGRHHWNVIWGGSWALDRETFDRHGVAAAWQDKLTEDVVATRVLWQAGLQVTYEPGCLCASPLDVDFRQAIAFMRRQFFLVRVYAPTMWILGLVFSSILQLGLLASLLATGIAICAGSPQWWVPAVSLGALYGCGVARAWLRQNAAGHVLSELREKLTAERWFDILAGPICGLAGWLVMLSSAFGHSTVWRGIRYTLNRDGQVTSVSRLHDTLDGSQRPIRLATAPWSLPAESGEASQTTGDRRAA